MIVKVAKIWANLGLNHSFAPKEDFLEKLTNIIYVYLVSPNILKHFKQILRADHQIKGWIINLAQTGSELPISSKRFIFGKTDCYSCLPTVFFYAGTFQ